MVKLASSGGFATLHSTWRPDLRWCNAQRRHVCLQWCCKPPLEIGQMPLPDAVDASNLLCC